MVRRPDLGYRDEGVNLSDPSVFDRVRRPFGEAIGLPRVAYRSLQFLYLEDEAIWTRDWVSVGTVHEIAAEGDILPFTLGYHGVHVQRMEDGSLEARFNMAQHGGCRMVPTQCQQGERTSCSFTSCGYSRDRGPITTGEGPDNTRTKYQYLGLRPERLHPVHVAQLGNLLFLNIDLGGTDSDLAGDLTLPAPVMRHNAVRAHRQWLEFDANWKFSGQMLARVDEMLTSSDRAMQGRRAASDGAQIAVQWIFPNLILLTQGAETCAITLQHTAITKTLFRIEILSDCPLDAERLAFWHKELLHAGTGAEALQDSIPSSASRDRGPDCAVDLIQDQIAAWWAHNALISRFVKMPQVDSDIPIFRNVEHYLI